MALFILALCGIGFGVFEPIDNNNKKQEISNLKEQASDTGQMSMGDNAYVAFILENGEVYYVAAQDLSGGSPVAARKMQVGNPVKDIVPAEVGTSGIGSYHSAILVFSDDSYTEFNNSML